VETSLDPLYAGADMAAPEIDYERGRVAAPRRPVAVGTGLPADRRRERGSRPKVIVSRRWGHLVLPIVALAIVAYVLMEPPLEGGMPEGGLAAPGDASAAARDGSPLAAAAADPALSGIRRVDKARRSNPGALPPHLRDVSF
jgi:hypothetical protein